MARNILTIFVCIFLISSCQKQDEIQFEKFITEWLILGPFPNSTGKTKFEPHDSTCFGYFTDYLLEHGGEAEIVPAQGRAHTSPAGDTLRWKLHTSPSYKINFNEIFTPNDQVVAYAATQISSSVQRDVVFSVGSDDGMKIWLNSELVYDRLLRRGARMDDDFVSVRLKKGANRILVKVEDVAGGWGFFFRIKELNKAKSYVMECFREILPKPYKIVSSQDSLFIPSCDDRFNIFNKSLSTDVEIFSFEKENNIIMKRVYLGAEKTAFVTDSLNDGYYKIRLNIYAPKGEKYKLEEKFYVGNIWKVRKNMNQRYNKYLTENANITNKVCMNLEENFKWLDYIIGNKPRSLDIDEGRRAFSAMIDLEGMLNALEYGKEPVKQRKGRLIRGYLSSVDNSIKYYQLYVPNSYQNDKPIPVVINIAGERPLVNSFFPYVVRQDQYIDVRKSLSDRYNFITVLINGRGNAFHQYVKGLGEDDIFSVINAIKKDYNIDSGRIFLIGYSAGGHAALDLGIRYSHQFAAVAAVSPNTDYRLSKDPSSLPPIIRLVENANNTIEYAENLLHVPVYLLHGSADEFTPVDHSLNMAQRLKKIGARVEFKEIPYATHSFYNIDPDKSAYEFFSKQKRIDIYPKRVIYKTAQIKYNKAYWVTIDGLISNMKQAEIEVKAKPKNAIEVTVKNVAQYTLELNDKLVNMNDKVTVITNNINSFSDVVPLSGKVTVKLIPKLPLKTKQVEGPIDNAFASSFVVVQGTTSKNFRMKKAIAKEVEEFQEKWQETYFGLCRVKKDIEITNQDIENHNLVLFGNAESNLITSKIIERLPIKFRNHKIVFNDEALSGDDPGFKFIYPNPLNKKKYIVLNAGLSSEAVTGMTQRFWEAGWCDFLIFDKYTRDINTGLLIGFFNNQWKFDNDLFWFGHPEARKYLSFHSITWKDSL